MLSWFWRAPWKLVIFHFERKTRLVSRTIRAANWFRQINHDRKLFIQEYFTDRCAKRLWLLENKWKHLFFQWAKIIWFCFEGLYSLSLCLIISTLIYSHIDSRVPTYRGITHFIEPLEDERLRWTFFRTVKPKQKENFSPLCGIELPTFCLHDTRLYRLFHNQISMADNIIVDWIVLLYNNCKWIDYTFK